MKMMGLDKLRLVSHLFPSADFFDEVNQDLLLPRDFRKYEVRFRSASDLSVRPITPCVITPKKGREPFFFLQLNFIVPGKGIVHVFELNPNNLARGLAEFRQVRRKVFGAELEDPAVSRIDLNADIQIPVEYFRQSLRVPRKRKATEYANVGPEPVSSFSNRGITGFCIGRSPSMLRVYNKREELLHLREDVSGFPVILTRLEWELRHKKCPVRLLSEIETLAQVRPFDSIEILGAPEVYDFHNYPLESTRAFLLKSLSAEYGAQDARRILNKQRNFARDFRPLTVEISEIKERLNRSYSEGVRRFFANEPSDVRSMLRCSSTGT